MAYKQEPCPLCGRDMTAIETYPGRGELYCGHCDLTIGGNDAKTPEELIALMDSSEHRRLKAENAELREDLDFERSENGYAIEFLDLMAKHCGTKDCPSLVAYVEQLRAENAKLREMIGDVGNTLFSLDIDYCGSCTADNVNHPCPVYTVKGGECLYKTAMRELGIEVE